MNYMRKYYILQIISILCLSLDGFAQDGHDAFAFLRFPTSARTGALGGYNVSLVETESGLIFQNPALLGAEMSGKVSVSYINYIADINIGSAVYTRSVGERGAWGIGATYINYGTMREFAPDNIELGTFSMQDVGLHAFYEYDLSEKWRGGLSLKFLYSTLADYTSVGLAADAGLSYFDSEKDFSFGIVFNNVGAQLKPFYEERQNVPWDLRMGISKRLEHAPFRFSLTTMYLNKWKLDYIDGKETTTDSFGETALKHLVLGLEFLPSDNFWLGVGVNPKTRMDMSLASGNALGGFSIGGGVRVSRFNVAASVARYHQSATSLMISVGISLQELQP
jgi:hypothetical protein